MEKTDRGNIKAVALDFGGVIAEEGFRKGLEAVAAKNGLDPKPFFSVAEKLIHDIGYVTGSAGESAYWEALRKKTGITEDDLTLRNEVLQRFILRPEVLSLVERVRASGFTTAVISDQTNWLEEINEQKPFFQYFDFIFNSFKIHKSKKDPSIFTEACSIMHIDPSELFFSDDSRSNIENAREMGLFAVLFTTVEDLGREIERLIPRSP